MIYCANVPTSMIYQILSKASKTATLFDGLVVADIDGKKKSRYKDFFEKVQKCVKYLRAWGEAGTVKTKKKTSPQFADRVTLCIFVGYTKDNEGD